MNAQQLKNSILQEAIEGRLVPQDPNDEPASVLLERIREEKERLYKDGLLKKKEITDRDINENEVPFSLPNGWVWTKIDNVAFVTKLAGFEYTKYIADNLVSKENGIPLFKGKNVQNGRIIYEFEAYIPLELSDELKRSQIKKKCLLTPYVGTIGNIGIHDKDGVFHLGSNVGKIEFYNRGSINILEEYAKYYLMSSYGYDELTKYKKATAQESISIEAIRDVFIPIPPISEQKRIVAKIEELLPKVEEYGKAQEALDKLNAELPEKLKKSILQEAIEGRLVPQDPNDEPASALLERIREEKRRLVKEGKLKKKDLEETPISEEEKPFEIPESWEWCRLGNMVSNQTGLSYSKGDLNKKSDNPIRVLRGGNIQNGSWCTKVDDVLIAPEFVKKQNLSLQKNTFITPAVTSLEHLGKTALVTEDYPNIVAGGFVLYLIPFYREETLAKYLSYFFQTAFYNKFCKSIANKSGQAFWNLSRQKLMNLAIPLPPRAEQHRIVAKIEELFAEIDKLKTK